MDIAIPVFGNLADQPICMQGMVCTWELACNMACNNRLCTMGHWCDTDELLLNYDRSFMFALRTRLGGMGEGVREPTVE